MPPFTGLIFFTKDLQMAETAGAGWMWKHFEGLLMVLTNVRKNKFEDKAGTSIEKSKSLRDTQRCYRDKNQQDLEGKR